MSIYFSSFLEARAPPIHGAGVHAVDEVDRAEYVCNFHSKLSRVYQKVRVQVRSLGPWVSKIDDLLPTSPPSSDSPQDGGQSTFSSLVHDYPVGPRWRGAERVADHWYRNHPVIEQTPDPTFRVPIGIHGDDAGVHGANQIFVMTWGRSCGPTISHAESQRFLWPLISWERGALFSYTGEPTERPRPLPISGPVHRAFVRWGDGLCGSTEWPSDLTSSSRL